MPTILDYYEYAKLATAAYVWLDGESLDGAAIARLSDFDQKSDTSRIPIKLAEQMFDPAKSGGQPVWTIRPGGYINDNTATGFAATLFERSGQKVLAIRGTEPTADGGVDLLQADLAGIRN